MRSNQVSVTFRFVQITSNLVAPVRKSHPLPPSWIRGTSQDGEDSDRMEGSDPPMQDIRFKVAIRGWRRRAHQHRANPLLLLQSEPMAKRMQEEVQDLIFLPKSWWSSATDSLEPTELGWWYKVSDSIHFKGCKACANRIGENFKAGQKTLGMRRCPNTRYEGLRRNTLIAGSNKGASRQTWTRLWRYDVHFVSELRFRRMTPALKSMRTTL